MFKWLSYGHGNAQISHNPFLPTTVFAIDPASESAAVDKDFLSRREFSFTMQDDIYIRYLSFKDEGDMQSWIQKKQPHKIDIGAVYTHPVRFCPYNLLCITLMHIMTAKHAYYN